MNIAPCITNSLHYENVGYDINLDLKTNLTFINDKSGTGKTFLYEIIDEQSSDNPNIICINYKNKKNYIAGELLEELKKSKGNLYVIDNADIILDDDTRKHIAFDTNNQYIIIGRILKNLMLSAHNCAEVIVNNEYKTIGLKYDT